MPEWIKYLKTISTSLDWNLEAPDKDMLVWNNLRSISDKKLSCMMQAASSEKFLESKRHSNDKAVKIMFKFYYLAHSFIEGVATKVVE